MTLPAELNTTKLDCSMKVLALQFARKIHNWRKSDDLLFTEIHDALRLSQDCKIPRTLSTFAEYASRQLRSKDKSIPKFCRSHHCIFVSANTTTHENAKQEDSINNPFGSTNEALKFSQTLTKQASIVHCLPRRHPHPWPDA